MTPFRYRVTLAYDGTAYHGWQVQPRHRTIQGECERVLQELSGKHTRVEASGRTDTGVHARGQVAHFDWVATPRSPAKLQLGLNALLPPDIRVLAVRRVPAHFHARFSATGKEYRYFIHNAEPILPDCRFYRLPVREPLDVAAMRAAATALEGHHDFAAFAANPNREIDGTCRTIHQFRITRQGPLIMLQVKGDGFLYRMVRSLTGFLIRVGHGELTPEHVPAILASGTRTARVPTAPPQGLFLWRVYYGSPTTLKKTSSPATGAPSAR